MEVLLLSRLQFAATTFFHFLFVPLTLGLSILIAIMETRWASSGNEEYRRMARFWGKIFVINFVLGVVTGITLEFQFGTNWSRYAQYVGDIFGSLLAIEATVAFFLESTLIGVWIFSWDRLSPKAHALVMWLIAAATNTSAYFILAANAWMQHPVGYVIRNGRAELDDFIAIITQRLAVIEFLHTVSAAYVLAGFFVMGVSAYHLLKKRDLSIFNKSFKLALYFALIFSIFVVIQGHLNGAEVARTQPSKLAAMESHWKTQAHAPIYLFALPNPFGDGNLIQILPIPGALSLLAFHDSSAVVKGLDDFKPEDRPPVLITFTAFKIMLALGMLFPLLTIWGFFIRNKLSENPKYLRIMLWSIPLPYIAIETGWIVTEVGRQPWLVWNVMRTAHWVSPVGADQVALSLLAFILFYSLLGAAAFWLMARYAKAGPEPAPEPAS
jgi:cytochrome bd ubiquinol oxidase subunit I